LATDPGSNPLAEAAGVAPSVLAGLIEGLREREQTVATAESITAGLVCAVLTSVPGSSAVVRGGLVVYATELKSVLAGVDPGLLARHGTVHPEVALRLAEGARDRCGATWGVGLTGVAGPGPQDGVPAGVVHLALAGPDGESVPWDLRLAGDRHEVRQGAVRAAVNLLVERALRW
jgi:nicotinamide-nucleotide amidase